MRRQSFWNHRFTRTRIKSEKVQLPEMLFGYILGPMGASISGSIFGSILQSYFTDVLRLDLRFLSRLQLVSTVLIVAANLLVGQLIERTRTTAGKARPWLLLSVFTFSSASVPAACAFDAHASCSARNFSMERLISSSFSRVISLCSSASSQGAGCSTEPHTGHGIPGFNCSFAISPACMLKKICRMFSYLPCAS